MIHALKIAMIHTKNNFHGQSTGISIIKELKIHFHHQIRLDEIFKTRPHVNMFRQKKICQKLP